MPTYEASVSRAFTASHSLRMPDGSAEPSHEHTWRMTATFRAPRLEPAMGVVIDFLDVEKALDRIVGQLDGTNLNALPAFADGRCSAELVAEHLAGILCSMIAGGSMLYRFAVTEAPGCTAAYYPAGA